MHAEPPRGRRAVGRELRPPTVLSGEKGTILKSWRKAVPVCVVYPNTYYVGMSSLAPHLLYKALNDLPGVVCERFFFDPSLGEGSIESGRRLTAFKVLFLTVAYELDYPNIPALLSRHGIPERSTDRRDGDPLVVAGGICVMANPEPVAEFVDLFIMGDVEATIPEFMERYGSLAGSARDTILRGFDDEEWVYRPGGMTPLYDRSGRVAALTPEGFRKTVRRYRGKTPRCSTVIARDTEFSGMFLVEGTRGCPSRCPFCLLGNTSPFVPEDLEGFPVAADRVGIIGGGASYHPHLPSIVRGFRERGMAVHLPSLRIDAVPLEVIEELKEDLKTLTFGLEAGSERLRRLAGKGMSDEEILDRISAILRIRPFNLKLYFMIGLFGEEMDDVEMIARLVKRINHVMVSEGSPKGYVGTLTVHASPFVPKPQTPFQWLPMADQDDLREKVARLRRLLAKADNTVFTHESLKFSFLQGVLARGDRRVWEVVRDLARGRGLKAIMRESHLNLNFFVSRTRGKREVFPWDFIRGQESRDRLWKRLTALVGPLAPEVPENP